MSTSTGSGTAVEQATAGNESRDVGPSLVLPAALLVLWMTSVLGFAAFAIALGANQALSFVAVTAALWLGTGLLGVPVMLYDAWHARGTPASEGFRFDSMATALGLLFVYPLGAVIYVVVRFQGPYLVAMGIDADVLDFGDELDFVVRELRHPTAEGVPTPWPAMMVLFLWLGVLLGDGVLVAALLGDGSGVLVGVGVAVVMRLIAVPALALDLYVATKTGVFEPTTAVALGLTTAVLFPVAAVVYLPYRLLTSYD